MAGPHVTPMIDVGIAGFILPGQTESGDLELVKMISNGMLLGVVDGLGHGLEAANAAREAIKTIASSQNTSAIPLVKCCHEALKKTRGATMGIAVLNTDDDTMTWLGIGNVEGVLLRADPHSLPTYESLLLRPGVVGYVLPQLYASVLTLSKGDMLVFASDGMRNDFARSASLRTSKTAQEIAEHLCSQYTKGTDDALVLVARYKGNHQ